jgi:hypothetical protein
MPPVATEQIVYVSTGALRTCPFCGESLGLERFEESCNHLLGHGLKCLHVGQETGWDGRGNPWHNTVAVFGK